MRDLLSKKSNMLYAVLISFIMVVIVLVSLPAFAADADDNGFSGFSFNLYDEQGIPLSDVLVKILFQKSGSTEIILFTDYLSDNLAYVELEKGNYIVTVFADNLITKGKDY